MVQLILSRRDVMVMVTVVVLLLTFGCHDPACSSTWSVALCVPSYPLHIVFPDKIITTTKDTRNPSSSSNKKKKEMGSFCFFLRPRRYVSNRD